MRSTICVVCSNLDRRYLPKDGRITVPESFGAHCRSGELSKTALITGITRADGATLPNSSLQRDTRCTASNAAPRRSTPIESTIFIRIRTKGTCVSNCTRILRIPQPHSIIQEVQPDEIYNLAAQSHVAVSFETPEYTANSDAVGTLRCWKPSAFWGSKAKRDFIRRPLPKCSARFRKSRSGKRRLSILARRMAPPRFTPIGITVNYREAYGLFACNGILFNHESPMRGETFVSRKITRALTRIKVGLQETLHLGNLDSRRDWGHARDMCARNG